MPTCAIFGAEGWTVTENVCHRLNRWENDLVCNLAKLRYPLFSRAKPRRQRINKRIAQWREDLGQLTCGHRALFAVFRWAWTVRHPRPGTKKVVDTLQAVQDHRPKAWWEEQQPFLEAADRSQTFESWRHRRRGRPRQPCEAPLVEALGPQCRARCQQATAAEWKVITKDAVNALCVAWHLPKAPEKKPPSEKRTRGRPKAKGKAGARGDARRSQTSTHPKKAEIPTEEEWRAYLWQPPWRKSEGSYRHYVDAQLVANWLNGQTKCLEKWVDRYAEPIFHMALKLRESWKPDTKHLICDWVPGVET